MATEATYPRRLQQMLNERPMALVSSISANSANRVAAVRVFNGGRGGTTMAFCLGLADEYKTIFQPDWVVILVRDGWAETFNPTQEVHYELVDHTIKIRKHWHWDSMSRRLKMLIKWHVRDLAVFQYGKRHYGILTRTKNVDDTKQN